MERTETQDRPTIAVLIPPPRRDEVLAPGVLDSLRPLARVVDVEGDTSALAAALPTVIRDADVLLTGWGTPPLTEEVLREAPRLKLIAHTAGSVRRLIPLSAFERGIVVCHAADVIAEAVCECTLLLILTGLRRLHLMDRALKAGAPWREAAATFDGHQLTGRNVGLIGCGYVARRVIALLKPFEASIRVYDPYLPLERAAELGVTSAPLLEVMAASEVVSNHAPITPETHHQVGARELAALRDGAVFVNTARSWTVDYDALLAELRSGRIWAALDVFDDEPLPADSPFRQLPNAFITPHQAGHTVETYLKQGSVIVEEVARFLTGQPLQYRLPRAAYETMA